MRVRTAQQQGACLSSHAVLWGLQRWALQQRRCAGRACLRVVAAAAHACAQYPTTRQVQWLAQETKDGEWGLTAVQVGKGCIGGAAVEDAALPRGQVDEDDLPAAGPLQGSTARARQTELPSMSASWLTQGCRPRI